VPPQIVTRAKFVTTPIIQKYDVVIVIKVVQ
ncbi:MAG: hypothetical protein ACI8RD_012818, partial [Bacillariaceae sp.]|jgi:hypothetical protein